MLVRYTEISLAATPILNQLYNPKPLHISKLRITKCFTQLCSHPQLFLLSFKLLEKFDTKKYQQSYITFSKSLKNFEYSQKSIIKYISLALSTLSVSLALFPKKSQCALIELPPKKLYNSQLCVCL